MPSFSKEELEQMRKQAGISESDSKSSSSKSSKKKSSKKKKKKKKSQSELFEKLIAPVLLIATIGISLLLMWLA